MSNQSRSTRQMLASHSTAKVQIFTYYLSTYLNILRGWPIWQRVGGTAASIGLLQQLPITYLEGSLHLERCWYVGCGAWPT
jgi:hypothetical protein